MNSRKTTICLCSALNLLNLTLSALVGQRYFSKCCIEYWKIPPNFSLQKTQWIFSHLKSNLYVFECLFILISLLVVFFSHFSYSKIYFNLLEARLIQHIANYFLQNLLDRRSMCANVCVSFNVILEKHCALLANFFTVECFQWKSFTQGYHTKIHSKSLPFFTFRTDKCEGQISKN